MHKKFQFFISFIIFINVFYVHVLSLDTPAQYESKITFYTYNSTGFVFNSTFDDNTTLTTSCSISGNFTFIIHGWGESINAFWPRDMIANFMKFRGGCVIFMDYSNYSVLDYYTLYTNFYGIQAVGTKKLIQLLQLGFDPLNGHAFGFSFGGQLTFEVLFQFFVTTDRRLARADVCEPAGPYFPLYCTNLTFHPRDCARFVQCIHTSTDKGTSDRYCQRDIIMGECGIYQVGQTAPPVLSHGMCPLMYNSSFTIDFPLLPKPDKCWSLTPDVNITGLPIQVMGFRFNTSLPEGLYYSPTCKKPPFNSSSWTCPS